MSLSLNKNILLSLLILILILTLTLILILILIIIAIIKNDDNNNNNCSNNNNYNNNKNNNSNCDAPNETDRFPRSADGSFKSSEGLPTPETSPLRPPKPPRTEVRQYSWRNSTRKEVCMHIRMLKPLKARKNKREVKSRHLESTNYDVMIDDDTLNGGVIIASSNNDVILRNVELNKAIARTRYAQKYSFVSKIGYIKSSLSVCSRTFTRITLLLAMIINVLGGLFNIRLSERKSTVGNSSSLFLSEPLIVISFRDSLFLSIL